MPASVDEVDQVARGCCQGQVPTWATTVAVRKVMDMMIVDDGGMRTVTPPTCAWLAFATRLEINTVGSFHQSPPEHGQANVGPRPERVQQFGDLWIGYARSDLIE
jgi:hypothetical protein